MPFVDFLVVVLPTVLAIVSVQVGIKLTKGENHNRWWSLAIVLGICASALTWVSQDSARKQHASEMGTQRQEQSKLQDKLDASLLAQENIKGQLSSMVVMFGTFRNTTNDKQISEALKKLLQPPPINSVLDADK